MRRSVLALIVAIATLLSFTSLSVAAPAAGTTRAIVVLSDEAGNPSQAAAAFGRQYGFTADLVYSHALRGFAAQVPSGRLAALRADPRVAYVELDQVARIYDQTVPTGIQRIFAPGNPKIDIDGADDWRVDVDVAVIDTGIDLDHPDLNVFRSVNCSGGSPFKQSCGSGGDDDNNHGTHVAGTIGAIDNGIGVVGVAPGARLWAVKVLRSDGSGYISWIIAGIDYVTANATSIEVANMSLGCECSSAAMDSAISKSVAAGVVYAVAAGNSDKDASTFSPANHQDVITVSALADFDGAAGGVVGTSSSPPYCRVDQDDTLADFSNWGGRIEIAAPGVCILSTIPGGYATYSGTSMASPHVAGAAALLASKNNPSNKTDVANIRSTLINNGNFDWNDDSGDGIKERLLDVSNTTVFDPVLVAGSGGGGGDTTASVAPTGLTATAGDAQVLLDWNDNAEIDLAGYNVYRGVTKVNGSLVGTSSYTDTGLTNGTEYCYTVTAVDTSNNESAHSSQACATPTASSSGTMHVGDLDGTASLKGKSGKWEATVTVTIHDAGHNGVPNASVTATWSGDKSGSVTGTTGPGGTVTFSTGAISNGPGSVTLTVDGVTHATLTYSGPNDVSNSITVFKPTP
jgi:hypothetical protein